MLKVARLAPKDGPVTMTTWMTGKADASYRACQPRAPKPGALSDSAMNGSFVEPLRSLPVGFILLRTTEPRMIQMDKNQNNPGQQNQNPSQKPGQQQGSGQKPGQQQGGGQKPGQQKQDDLIEKIEEDNRQGSDFSGGT